jgi:hypothetical protein
VKAELLLAGLRLSGDGLEQEEIVIARLGAPQHSPHEAVRALVEERNAGGTVVPRAALELRQADREAGWVDAGLGRKAHQAAERLLLRASGNDEHRVLEIADQRVERAAMSPIGGSSHGATQLDDLGLSSSPRNSRRRSPCVV